MLPRNKQTTFAVVLACGLLAVAALHSQGTLINVSWLTRTVWTWPLLMGALWLAAKQRAPGASPRLVPLLALVCALGLYLFSSAAANPVFYYPNWAPTTPWELGKGWLERTLLLTALLVPIELLTRRRFWIVLLLALVGIQLSAFAALWHATEGAPIYRVDHPAFFYRLWSFGQSMPRSIYYDPFWNGGKVMPYLLASGILSPGLFLWPVWKFVSTHVAYTPAFGFLFLIVVPLLAAFSARLLSRSREMAVAAALLSLGTSHFYFVHLVHYGTIGSLFATAFLMPLAAALYRMVIRQRTDRLTVVSLFGSGLFLLCWPPAAVMAIPIGIAILCNARRLTRRTLFCLVGFAAAMVVVFALPAMSLLVHSDVQALTRTTRTGLTVANLREGWHVLANLLRQTHPAILFLGLIGACLSPSKDLRRWFAPILIASMLIAGWGAEWKADLQLDRVLINALFIGILPAAWAISTLMRSRTIFAVPAAALLSALLLMGGYDTVKYMGNKGRARFRTMSPEVAELAAWLKANTPADGRIMFAGAAVHGYSAAKIAALPIYTEREMLSCDYYGFSPKLVEYNYPTKEFRKHGKEKLLLFMDLYNITHIVTYHEDWKRYFRKHTVHFAEQTSFEAKTIFHVKRESSMFLAGSGTVEAGINAITCRSDGNALAVIKYNWVEGLSCKPASASVRPYDTGTSIQLIAVDPGGAEAVTISYNRWY